VQLEAQVGVELAKDGLGKGLVKDLVDESFKCLDAGNLHLKHRREDGIEIVKGELVDAALELLLPLLLFGIVCEERSSPAFEPFLLLYYIFYTIIIILN
jgi:hypothetical protein